VDARLRGDQRLLAVKPLAWLGCLRRRRSWLSPSPSGHTQVQWCLIGLEVPQAQSGFAGMLMLSGVDRARRSLRSL
jgi:hypothetical protein